MHVDIEYFIVVQPVVLSMKKNSKGDIEESIKGLLRGGNECGVSSRDAFEQYC